MIERACHISREGEGEGDGMFSSLKNLPGWISLRDPQNGAEWRESGEDLFDCLQKIREELEPYGVRLRINGARIDARPSVMLRKMTRRGACICSVRVVFCAGCCRTWSDTRLSTCPIRLLDARSGPFAIKSNSMRII